MTRCSFRHAGLTFSYLDSAREESGSRSQSVDQPAIIALHAHWMEGITFQPLAEVLSPEWRVIALDQRGHGYSDHANTYGREDYLGDLDALFDHLRLEQAVLLGNSLGGVNAYQYAARNPERVQALVIEDIGLELSAGLPDMSAWSGVFTTRVELESRLGARFAPYLRDSFRETPSGWTLAFEPCEMTLSEASLKGNYWAEWLSTNCPALVVRGSESKVTTAAESAEMARRRPNTQLRTLQGGHVLHCDDLAAFAEAIHSFLQSCRLTSSTKSPTA